MSDPLHTLALIACDIKAGAPNSFASLLLTVQQWEEKSIDEFLAAPPDAILGAQSKANMVRQLRQKLQNCTTIRDQVEKRR